MAEAKRITQLRAQQQLSVMQQPMNNGGDSPSNGNNSNAAGAGDMDVDTPKSSRSAELHPVKEEPPEIRIDSPQQSSRQPVASRDASISQPTGDLPDTAPGEGATLPVPPNTNGNAPDHTQMSAGSGMTGSSSQTPAQMAAAISRQPQELLEEILSILKTAFPLLALSMEKMVDHINVRAKAPIEEDVYRFLSALLTDAISVSSPPLDRSKCIKCS